MAPTTEPRQAKIQALILIWTFIVICIPNFVYATIAVSSTSYLPALVHLSMAVGLAGLAWSCLGSRLALWASLPVVLMAQFETYHIIKLGKPSTIGMIGSLIDSSPDEAREMIQGSGLLVLAGLTLPIAQLAILWLTRKREWTRQPLTKRVILATVALALLLPEASYVATRPLTAAWKRYVVFLDAEDTFPFGLLYKSSLVLKKKYVLVRRSSNIGSFDWMNRRSSREQGKETYVIIVGESSTSRRWSLYGYDKPTSPGTAADTSLFVFSDMTSGANLTSESLPQLLSLATPENPDRFNSSSSILSCFRQAGFKTWWISTQSKFGPVDGTPTKIGKEADNWRFLSTEHDSDANVFDGNLLTFFDRAMQDTATRKLIVLHTLGSHFDYSKRYPKSFERFPVRSDSSKHQFTYDNSIAYTDWFIEQVLTRTRSSQGIRAAIYISDHGESRGEKGNYGHGNPNPTRAEFEVPFLVWTSPELIQRRPTVARNLRNHLDAKASSLDFLPTILDIADVHSSRIDSTRSIARASYQPHSRQALLPQGSVIDVDQLGPPHPFSNQPVASIAAKRRI